MAREDDNWNRRGSRQEEYGREGMNAGGARMGRSGWQGDDEFTMENASARNESRAAGADYENTRRRERTFSYDSGIPDGRGTGLSYRSDSYAREYGDSSGWRDRSGMGGEGSSMQPYTDRGYSIQSGSWSNTRGQFAGKGPKNYTRSDERIREDVNEMLTQHPDIDASDIEVEVENGVVTLNGAVPDKQSKRMCEDAIENLPGVKDVRVELRTGGNGANGSMRNSVSGTNGRSGANGSTDNVSNKAKSSRNVS
jgi:hypothetical protein